MKRRLAFILFFSAFLGLPSMALASEQGVEVSSISPVEAGPFQNDIGYDEELYEGQEQALSNDVSSQACRSVKEGPGSYAPAGLGGMCGQEASYASFDNVYWADDAGQELNRFPDVPIVVNKSVESFITYFQGRGRKYFERWLGRSQDYMVMLKSILREKGLPEDLSYIALIESGLNPTARSKANAVGMWQFIKGTALRYGLRVDWWIDERMDPEKATYAAARYFSNLYDQFGSWYLAAAGYNAGEGRVLKAVKKHNSEDFWFLASHKKPLKRETREYVPKYLAATLIAKDPTTYGFAEQEYTTGLEYEKVKIAQATDLKVIAEAAGTSVEEIRRLNPELLRWFTPPNYPDYEVKIPAGASRQFAENIVKIPPAQRIAFVKHKVKRGETLSKISKKYGVATKPIAYLNNMSGTKLKPGSVIMIPVRANDSRDGKEVAIIHTRELQS